MELTVLQPSRATVMIKPVGALCNLDCTYCYYLPTKEVFGGREHRMSSGTLEAVFASLLPRFDDHVSVVWQGGEPTLAGLEFFEGAMELQRRHSRPGQTVANSLQTNCTLLDDGWCGFLREHRFLVGASVDGPPELHDHYRVTNRGSASSEMVRAGIAKMLEHGVEFNLLCVLNDRNVHHPSELWKHLLSLGSPWLQFIPAIEWEPDPSRPGRNRLAAYSPSPRRYGRFLCDVFDRWYAKHTRRVSVRLFDAVLNKLVLDVMPLCILDGSCHNQLTIEHDGSVFGCDHFIEPRWRLARIDDPGWRNAVDPAGDLNVGLTVHGGSIKKKTTHAGRDIHTQGDIATRDGDAAGPGGVPDDWLPRVDETRLGTFAARKQHLPSKCRSCRYKPYCHGGCPKHRPAGGDIPEPTILCEAYMMFFKHALPRLNKLAAEIRAERGFAAPTA